MRQMKKYYEIATQMYGSATQLGGKWGFRVLPDKCVCVTNAYLAISDKTKRHPSGCQQEEMGV